MTGQSVGWSGNDPRERRAAGLLSGDALGDGLELDGNGKVRLKLDPKSDLEYTPQRRELTRKAQKGGSLSLDGVELLIHKDRASGYAGLDASTQVLAAELGGASYGGASTKVLIDSTPPTWGVIPAGALTAHAPTHQHGGADEVATATPGADDIPKALGTGKLAAGWVSEVLALLDLTDVAAVTGTGTTAVLSGAPVFTGAPTIPDFTNAQHDHSSAAEGGVIVAGPPGLHATTHQHGGTDEVATATPGADDIPKALGTGKLAAGWTSETLALADLTDVTATTGSGSTVPFATSPVLTTPVIGDFSTAQHNHSSAATGGVLAAAPPAAHAASHQHGGSDEVATSTPGANVIVKANASSKIPAGFTSETLALADLTDVTATTGSGSTAVLNDTPTLLTPTVADFTNAQHDHSDAANGGLIAGGGIPAAHAASHQHGGTDEVATATPAANAIPKADASNKLAAGWVSEVLAIADLSDATAKTGTGTVVVMDTSPTIVTPTVASFVNANHSHLNAAGGGTLDAAAIASGSLALARITEVLALANLTDVTTKTGTGTVVVMDTSPTIVTPVIASFTTAQHSHLNAAGGGTLDAAAVASGTFALARVTEVLALANLTDVTATTGTGSTVPFATSPTLTTPVIGDFTTAQHNHSSAATGGTLAAPTPAAHATTHQHGGSDEVAVSIPAANGIPKADGTGKLSAGWISETLALSGLSDVTAKTGTGTIVVMDTSPTIVTPTIASFVNANHNHSSAATGGAIVAASTTVAGVIEISTDGEASATTAVVGTDNRLLTMIDTSQRSVRSVLSSPGVGVPFVAATAYFVYLGRVAKTTTFGFVRWLIRSAASGAQVAECGFFSSPVAPSRAGQTLTKLAATGTLSNLTVTGPASNSTTLAASIPAGTHLWSGIRMNMGTSQGSAYGLLQDQGQGRVLSTAGASALTGAGPWVGALITDTGIALCAGIEATLD